MPTFRYSIDMETIPSVTGVIALLGENKRALIHSAWKLGTEGKNYRDEWGKAANAGTGGHALAEAYLTHQPLPALLDLSPEERQGAFDRLENLKLWLSQNTYEPVASEVSLVSKIHRYGGTIDCVGLVNGKPAIIDLKSKTLYKDQIIQVAAYRGLWDENNPTTPIDSVHILGMSDGFHHHMITNEYVRQGWDAFLHLRALHGILSKLKP